VGKYLKNLKTIYSDDFGCIIAMTIGNIACDTDLNMLKLDPKLLGILIARVEGLANALENKDCPPRRMKIEHDKLQLEFIEDDLGYNLFECLQALFKYSVNDQLKTAIYEIFNIKPILKTIIDNGNSSEQEYSFKLLYQLCFDEKISSDVGIDTDLMNLMKSIASNEETKNKKLLKYVSGILWLINDKNKSKKTTNEELKHIFISYNTLSRKTCLQIKSFLETLGHKVWIDTEDIHGSSIDAMAKGIVFLFE
jgi:hypothetical protein